MKTQSYIETLCTKAMLTRMSTEVLYLDHAATAPLLPVAREALLHGFAMWANPSSPHKAGRAARAALEDARARILDALGWGGELIFTSGASEALAIGMQRCRLPVAAVSAVEHESVLRHAGVGEAVGVNADGQVDIADVARPGLVAIQHANNETGVIQPIGEIGAKVRAAGGLLLADCAQTAGKLALPDADMVAISAHKFGGPIGVGALLVRDYAMLKPSGGQERGYRGGTENMPGALAMAAALEVGTGWMDEARRLRDLLETRLTDAGAQVVGAGSERIATIAAYRMPGVSAAAQLIRFDAMGIAVSAGSACSSGSLRTSHVLGAMGMDDKTASEVIRVSIGIETTELDIDRFADAWLGIAAKGRAA